MKISACFPYLTIISTTFIFCEFFIYYSTIYECKWPDLNNSSEPGIKAIFLADTHLLGPRRGHWFDKLRREWQMHRAFQSSIFLLKPNIVFMLGDIFDEGQWSDQEQFATYMDRFSRLFSAPEHVAVYVVPGNHDIGFHYVTTPRLVRQFHQAFNLSSVQLLSFESAQFVLINSMAFEGDDCDLCTDADFQLKEIAKSLDCGVNGSCPYGRPILLQHFPMYRRSDKVCDELDDAPEDVKQEIFREKWDCLSKNATEQMLQLLTPRAIFTGHTHHGCHVLHGEDIHEYTVPSFSWRNKDNPTFTMATFTADDYAVDKCFMPRESTVIYIYTCSGIFILMLLILQVMIFPLLKKFIPFWSLCKRKNS